MRFSLLTSASRINSTFYIVKKKQLKFMKCCICPHFPITYLRIVDISLLSCILFQTHMLFILCKRFVSILAYIIYKIKV